MGRDGVDLGVDFVVGEDPAPTDPPPRGPRRVSRRGLLAMAALVVVAAGGLTVRSLTRRDVTTAAANSAAATQDRDSSTALDPSRAVASPLATPSVRLACPQFVACETTLAAPAPLVSAVRGRFPQARVVRSQTLLLRRDNTSTAEVRARLVVFRAGALEVFVRVSTPGADEEGAAVPVNTRTVIRTAPTGQYVTVEVAAQNGVELPGYDVLQRLVADSRLLAT